MRARRTVLAIVASALAVAALAHAQQPPTVAGVRPTCVAVSFSARYSGYGYNHLVTIHNTCASAATCTVTTDVNPAPTQVAIAKDATETVSTFVGSPARTFVPTVACTLAH